MKSKRTNKRNAAPVSEGWRIEPKPSFYRSWEVEEKALRAYLYWEIPKREVEACQHYEFSRYSDELRRCAGRLQNEPGKAARHYLLGKDASDAWIILSPTRRAICCCPAFPELPWTELNADQKESILKRFPARETPPLDMLDVREVQPVFAPLARAVRRLNEDKAEAGDFRGLYRFQPARVEQGSFEYVAFIMDRTEAPGRIVARLKAWLAQNESRQKFKPPGRAARDKPKSLQDLAISILFTRFGLSKEPGAGDAHDWLVKHQKGDTKVRHQLYPDFGNPYLEESEFRRAKSRALATAKSIFPTIFRTARLGFADVVMPGKL